MKRKHLARRIAAAALASTLVASAVPILPASSSADIGPERAYAAQSASITADSHTSAVIDRYLTQNSDGTYSLNRGALQYQEDWKNLGAIGFFLYEGWDAAADIYLRPEAYDSRGNSASNDTTSDWELLKDYYTWEEWVNSGNYATDANGYSWSERNPNRNLGLATDSTAYDRLQDTIDLCRGYNACRERENASDTRVGDIEPKQASYYDKQLGMCSMSPEIVAHSLLNTNFSAATHIHAGYGKLNEVVHLAFNGSDDKMSPDADVFGSLYAKEKANFVKYGFNTAANNVGHYLNIVNPDMAIIGAAATTGGKKGACGINATGKNQKLSNVMSIDDYQAALDSYKAFVSSLPSDKTRDMTTGATSSTGDAAASTLAVTFKGFDVATHPYAQKKGYKGACLIIPATGSKFDFSDPDTQIQVKLNGKRLWYGQGYKIRWEFKPGVNPGEVGYFYIEPVTKGAFESYRQNVVIVDPEDSGSTSSGNTSTTTPSTSDDDAKKKTEEEAKKKAEEEAKKKAEAEAKAKAEAEAKAKAEAAAKKKAEEEAAKKALFSKTGLYTESGRTFYYVKGVAQKGFQTVSGKRYYANPSTGAIQTGLMTVSGKVYYANTSGQLQSGWQTVSGKKYYFNPSTCQAATGFQKIGAYTYYFNPSNAQMALWGQKIGGYWYYFNGSGQMYNKGWLTWSSDGRKSYYDANGRARTGFQKISGKTYYFDPANHGKYVKWSQKIGGYWYYFNGSGQMHTGWLTYSSDKRRAYHDANGRARTGLQKVGGKWYYFDPAANGKYARYSKKIGASWYYFNYDGTMKTGWLKWSKDGTWSYFDSNGRARTGWQKIGGKTYYFRPADGHSVKWSQKINGKWYYFNGSSQMHTGWLKWSKTGKWSYYNGSGAMVTGWQKIGGKQYWFDSNGYRATGWTKIGGYKYYFNGSGQYTGSKKKA